MSRRAMLVLLMLITFAVLGRSVFGEFTFFDDHFTISTNPRLNPPTWDTLVHYWDPRNTEYGLYVPMTYTVWAFIASIARVSGDFPGQWTLNPWMFHAANLFVHSISVLMVFAILRTLIRHQTGAMLGAILFAIHPLQVESVAWMSGLKDVLGSMFALIALWCYVQFALSDAGVNLCTNHDSTEEGEPLTANARYGFYAAGAFFLILGMLSKPSVMTLPVIAGCIDRLLLRRSWRDAIVSAGIWQIVIMPLMWIAQFAQPATGVPQSPLWARPLIAFDSIAFYIGKLILPMHLAVDYGRTAQRVIDSGVMWWTMLVPLALGAVVLLARKDLKEALPAFLVFIIAPLPTLGFKTLLFSLYSTVSDHYVYLAMLGPALLTAALVKKYGRNATVVASLVLCVLTVMSFRQTAVWRSDFTLFRHALSVNPASFLAASNLGSAYANAGENEESLRIFEQGIQADPEHFQTQLGYGLALIRMGRSDEGIEWCDEAMQTKSRQPPEIRGNLISPLYAIAQTLMVHGHRDEAMRFIRIAAQTMPDSPQVKQLIDELNRSPATTQPPSKP